MNKFLPLMGLIIILVVGGVWLSNQGRGDLGVNAQASQTNTDSDADAETESDSASAEESTETTESQSEDAEADSAGDAVTDGTVNIPEGFTQSSYLSEEQVQEFDQAEDVLEEGTDYGALIKTNKGVIQVNLFEELAPNTVNNFVFLARNKYYDGIVFHRVLEDFMAQTGDPTGTGRGGPGYTFEDEFVDELTHDSGGILSMANSGPNTNGSQFFITFEATPWLDGRHSVFGEVVAGDDVLGDLSFVDPSNPQPSAIATYGETGADLSDKGISLDIEADETVEAYLERSLDTIPEMGERFELGEYSAVVGRVNEEPAIGFFPEPDVMEEVIIIEKPKGDQ